MNLYCRSIFLVVLLFVVSNGFAQKRDFNPRKEALDEFERYIPFFGYNDDIVDNPTPIYGDINGDGAEDCIISYYLISKKGGNAIVGHVAAIYLNIDSSMKWADHFPLFIHCYTLEYIKDQVIYGKQYKCKPPYNTVVRERKFKFVKGKLRLIS